MKKLIAPSAIALAGSALNGCGETSMVRANETPRPALQSAYCVQHSHTAPNQDSSSAKVSMIGHPHPRLPFEH